MTHHGSISRAELRAMRDPIARMVWESWIAREEATLTEDEV